MYAHNIIGIIDNANDSLFTYGSEESWSTFYQPDFDPAFAPTFSSPALEQQANAICGNDPFCRFDIAATSRTDIGLTTLQGNIEFETISNNSQQGMCFCNTKSELALVKYIQLKCTSAVHAVK